MNRHKVFEIAVNKTDINLPKGQSCLRHTLVSHFMVNAGDFLVLLQVLGHARKYLLWVGINSK